MLTVFFVVLAILILLLCLGALLPAEFGLEIIKTVSINNIFLRFKFLGIPIKIPLKQKKSKKVPLKDSKNKEQKLSFKAFKENVSSLKEVYESQKHILKDMLSYVRKHTSIKSVDFKIHFGLDNAAATGISTGAIWGMGSFVLKIIDSLIGIKKINMRVDPDFNNKVFEIYSKTILIMKPIHLIITVGQVLKTINYVNNKINNIKGGANNGTSN